MGVLALDALGVDVAGLLDRRSSPSRVSPTWPAVPKVWCSGLRSNPLTRAPRARARTHGRGGLSGDRRDYEEAVRVLADSAALWGLLSEPRSGRG